MARYAQMILPLAVPGTFSYEIPLEFQSEVRVGMRAEVQFGKRKHYSGIISELHEEPPGNYKNYKKLLTLLDEEPIITAMQLKLWAWIARYYCCTIGEVMLASIPNSYRLVSETRIVRSERFEEEQWDLDDQSYLIYEALQHNEFLTIQDVQDILQIQTIFPIIEKMIRQDLIKIEETLLEKYKVKTEKCVRLLPPFSDDPSHQKAMALLEGADKQLETLLAYITLSKNHEHVLRSLVKEKAGIASYSSINTLVKKQILEVYEINDSRIVDYFSEDDYEVKLSTQQKTALGELDNFFNKEGKTALVHGVTGSGKTELYISYIKELLTNKSQVLYLVPEIALTTQLTHRLSRMFGEELVVYHSKLNDQERVEIWQAILKGDKRIIVSARSGILLPFHNLGLIVIDEEHDHSFKQYEPAPRYHARDVAIYGAHQIWDAKVILGSATPSIETYYKAQTDQYGYIPMTMRYGKAELPHIEIAQIGRSKDGTFPIFGNQLREKIQGELDNGRQVIIFKNRRGYAPRYICSECDWHAECENCDVSLTYHQNAFKLQCHYCGFQQPPVRTCPDCGATTLKDKGVGTEKLEEELTFLFPDYSIKRLDADTTRGKYAMEQIVSDFQLGKVDILVGTQMVSKGLDFQNVTLVGIIDVEAIFQFPDFRSHERSYQLLRQVTGRSGRGEEKGEVLIQSKFGKHPVLEVILENKDEEFYRNETLQRREFSYPPFVRLISVHLEHKSEEKVIKAATFISSTLRKQLGSGVLGPSPSRIPRLRNRYRYEIFLKLPINRANFLDSTKTYLLDLISHTNIQSGMSGVKIFVDVDPM